MKRTIVLRFERQPLTGLVKARCDADMEKFVLAAATIKFTDSANIVREAIRDYARKESSKNSRLKRFARPILSNGI